MLWGVEGLGLLSRPLASPPLTVSETCGVGGGGAFESGVQPPYLGFR